MNKLMTVVAASVCAVSLSGSALAAENQSTEKEALEEEESKIFEAGFDFDYFSAYIWRNAVQNDRQVMQPCIYADFTMFEPFWVGIDIWQNYDLTDRRRDSYKRAQTDTDYNVHAGVTAWENDDGDMNLEFELGHDWFTYQGVRPEERSFFCDTREIYLKTTFSNPIVDVYGQVSWMYQDLGDYRKGFYYELGLKKEVDLALLVDALPEETLKFGADWNVNFGDHNYMQFLYGDVRCRYEEVEDDEGEVEEELVDCDKPFGIGGTTVKFYLDWAITDWMTLSGTIAYTGILNAPVRDQVKEDDDHRDYCWGGLSLRFSY